MVQSKSIVSLISETIVGKPYAAQIAKDNRWEDCWIIKLDKGHPSEAELSDYLSKSNFSSLAVELLFKNTRGQTTIFGFIHNPVLKSKERLEFLATLLELATSTSNFQKFISLLEKEVVGSKGFLFSSNPDLIRVGVVNYWFSIGPVDIWKAPSPLKLSREELISLLEKRPQLQSTVKNYQGVSFIYNSNPLGLYYWIKPQCGIQEGKLWKVDTRLVLDYLTQLFGFSSG